MARKKKTRGEEVKDLAINWINFTLKFEEKNPELYKEFIDLSTQIGRLTIEEQLSYQTLAVAYYEPCKSAYLKRKEQQKQEDL